ncbi:hypothetical protein [Sphingomonas sanxanigenens]|uniref:Uncharacterized protein n=1 Tax=Sphingomonas sanxanigenens DSM 19645 = NX02 TaxID=1123269 RepID=W0A3Q0_9SPHN|nr:hypothetical protein [Sphingomonas sanxanigenens]AHE52564.1 hypothetical protein NX02_04055 [Sphingomonas sanxanigenens DSM 19645 = NX02]
MALLLAEPAFCRFLARMVQMAGLLSPASNGADGRDLHFHEGRRSLAFDLLREAEAGQPVAARHPHAVATLVAALTAPKPSHPPQPAARRGEEPDPRYDDIDDEQPDPALDAGGRPAG